MTSNLQVVAATTPVSLDRLLESLTAGLAPNTRRAYSRDWRAVAQWANQRDTPGLIEWLCSQGRAQCHLTLLDWRTWALNVPLAPATINRTLAAVAFLLKSAYQAELIDWTVTVPRLQVDRLRDVRGPSDDQVAAMLTTCNQRDRAIILCLYTLGLRRAEICALNVGSLDGDRLAVMRKGKREATWLTVPQSTMAAILGYLSGRKCDAPDPLFLTSSGKRMRGGDIYYMVQRRATDAGIVGHITPHKFRHSAVNGALEATNGDIASVAAFCGHSSPTTTQVYWDKANNAQGRVANVLAERLDKLTTMK